MEAEHEDEDVSTEAEMNLEPKVDAICGENLNQHLPKREVSITDDGNDVTDCKSKTEENAFRSDCQYGTLDPSTSDDPFVKDQKDIFNNSEIQADIFMKSRSQQQNVKVQTENPAKVTPNLGMRSEGYIFIQKAEDEKSISLASVAVCDFGSVQKAEDKAASKASTAVSDLGIKQEEKVEEDKAALMVTANVSDSGIIQKTEENKSTSLASTAVSECIQKAKNDQAVSMVSAAVRGGGNSLEAKEDKAASMALTAVSDDVNIQEAVEDHSASLASAAVSERGNTQKADEKAGPLVSADPSPAKKEKIKIQFLKSKSPLVFSDHNYGSVATVPRPAADLDSDLVNVRIEEVKESLESKNVIFNPTEGSKVNNLASSGRVRGPVEVERKVAEVNNPSNSDYRLSGLKVESGKEEGCDGNVQVDINISQDDSHFNFNDSYIKDSDDSLTSLLGNSRSFEVKEDGAALRTEDGVAPKPADGAALISVEDVAPKPADGAAPKPADGAAPRPTDGVAPRPNHDATHLIDPAFLSVPLFESSSMQMSWRPSNNSCENNSRRVGRRGKGKRPTRYNSSFVPYSHQNKSSSSPARPGYYTSSPRACASPSSSCSTKNDPRLLENFPGINIVKPPPEANPTQSSQKTINIPKVTQISMPKLPSNYTIPRVSKPKTSPDVRPEYHLEPQTKGPVKRQTRKKNLAAVTSAASVIRPMQKPLQLGKNAAPYSQAIEHNTFDAKHSGINDILSAQIADLEEKIHKEESQGKRKTTSRNRLAPETNSQSLSPQTYKPLFPVEKRLSKPTEENIAVKGDKTRLYQPINALERSLDDLEVSMKESDDQSDQPFATIQQQVLDKEDGGMGNESDQSIGAIQRAIEESAPPGSSPAQQEDADLENEGNALYSEA